MLSKQMKHQPAFTRFVVHFENPLFASVSAFIVYFVLSTLRDSPFGVTDTAYFNYLADSFLHGQLHLRLLPPSLHDLSFFQGKHYLYWPPMPAIVLMPFVAIFGVNFSDIFFTTVFVLVKVGLLALLFGRGRRERWLEGTEVVGVWLVLFLPLATVKS